MAGNICQSAEPLKGAANALRIQLDEYDNRLRVRSQDFPDCTLVDRFGSHYLDYNWNSNICLCAGANMLFISQVGMDQDKIRHYLSMVDLFRDIQPAELDLIIKDAFLKQFQPEEFLFYQDDPADGFFVILEGRIKLSQLTPDGSQVTFHYLKPGEAFGIIAVLRGVNYPVTAEAMEACQVIGWHSEQMVKWIRTYPQIALNSIQILSGFILDFQDRIRELSTERVERRIARTLLRLASHGGEKTDSGISLGMKLTRQDIAEMSGTTLFTVSRILSKWEDLELVNCQSSLLTITNPHKLTEIAEDLQISD